MYSPIPIEHPARPAFAGSGTPGPSSSRHRPSPSPKTRALCEEEGTAETGQDESKLDESCKGSVLSRLP